MHFFSRDSAEELAQEVLKARVNNTDFELALVLVTPGQGEADAGAYRVREVRTANRLFDGREIVHCVSVAAGRKIEIMFPPPGEREVGVAEVLIEGD